MGIEQIEYQPKLVLNSRPPGDDTKVVFLEARASAN
jgi:hypothetical protein